MDPHRQEINIKTQGLIQRILEKAPKSIGTGQLKFGRIVQVEVENRIDFNIYSVKGGYVLTATFMKKNALTAGFRM